MFEISAGREAYDKSLNWWRIGSFSGRRDTIKQERPMEMRQRFTFKIVNLRLEFLFPRTVVTKDFHDLVVTATFKGRTRLVLLEC